MHPLLAKRIEIPWARVSKGIADVLRPMKFTSWKWPVALGSVACSLVPIALLCCIDHIELYGTVWSHKHQTLPFIAWTFLAYHRLGWLLPILTTVVGVWFLTGKCVTASRLGWAAFLLVILHLFWFSYAILAFYLTNQKFVL